LSVVALFIVASKLMETEASKAFKEKCMVFSPSIASQWVRSCTAVDVTSTETSWKGKGEL